MAEAKLARSVFMSSLIDSICSGGDDTTVGSGDGDTDDGSGGKGDMDLLRDKDSKNDGGVGVTPRKCDQGRGQGNGRNQNGDAINDNIWGDVRNVIENNDRKGCTYKEFLACNHKEYDGKEGAVVYTS
nr:hypothetical protein [Tanacetum cinerariifolium]